MSKKVYIILLILFIPMVVYGETQKAKEQVLLNLQKEYNRLKEWEKRLKEQEKRLQRLEIQILTEKEEIIKIQEKLNNIIKELKQIREANVSQLSIVYSKMKPENAAEIINNMPTQLAVKIFLKMQPNKIAKILNFTDREKAIRITEKLSLYGININLKGR